MNWTPSTIALLALALMGAGIAHAENIIVPGAGEDDPAPAVGAAREKRPALKPNDLGFVDLFSAPPASIAAFSAKPDLSYCGYAGCTPGDTQRSQFLIRAPSRLGGTQAEIPFFVNYAVNTGRLTVWRASMPVKEGDIVNSSTSGNLYKAKSRGTTAATGTGPAGKGNAIKDGSVTWEWIAFGQVDAKIAGGFETVMGPEAGRTWSLVTNLVLKQGAPRTLAVGFEADLGNFSGNCDIDGQSLCTPMFLFGDTAFTSTAAQVISTGAPPNVTAYHFGTWYQRAANGNLVKDATIVDDTNAAIAIGIGQTAGRAATHATATFRDLSTSPIGLLMAGHYAKAALSTEGADIDGNGGAATAIRLRPHHATCFNGGDNCLVYDPAKKKLFYIKGNLPVMSIDDTGNIRTRGTITTNVEP